MPVVSVIMGAHDNIATMERCVRSVLCQTHQDLELIVVNDGSTDGSGQLLNKLSQNDHRLRVIDQANQGLTKSLIKASEFAAGEYIARQDADDFSLAERIEKQLAALEQNHEAVLATCWVEDSTENGVVCSTHRSQPYSVRLNKDVLYTLTGIPAHGSVMMRKDAFLQCGGYRACFYYAQDSDLWLRLSQQGQFVTVPEVLYQRTISTSSISSRFPDAQRRFCDFAQESFRRVLDGQNDSDVLEAAEQLAAECEGRKNTPTSQRDEATSLMMMASALSTKDPTIATQFFYEALKKDPTHLRAWKGFLLHSLKQLIGTSHEVHCGKPRSKSNHGT